jgi:hypothetical protein
MLLRVMETGWWCLRFFERRFEYRVKPQLDTPVQLFEPFLDSEEFPMNVTVVGQTEIPIIDFGYNSMSVIVIIG